MALTEAIKEAIWLGGLLNELGVGQKQIPIYYNNQSSICLAKNPVFHVCIKHINVCYHFVWRLLVNDDSYFKRLGLPRILQIC